MILRKFFPARFRHLVPQTPSPELVRLTGFTTEELKSAEIVPEYDLASPAGYRLVIADPATVDSAAFTAVGVEIRTGRRDEIERAWSGYLGDKTEDSNLEGPGGGRDIPPLILETLTRLANDAAEQGATEVFIGYPGANDFEFLGRGSRFRGQVDSRLGRRIARHLQDGEILNTVVADPIDPAVRRLIIGCVREFNRPLVYLSWDGGPDPAARAVDGASAIVAFPRETEAHCSSNSAKTIVMIDDDIRYLAVLGGVLRRRGWTVHSALQAQAGLKLIRSLGNDVDLVIVDVKMPGTGGLEFLARLRHSRPDLPVLMLTSDAESDTEIAAIRAGADGLVLKQRELNLLLAWICRLIDKPYLPADRGDFSVPPEQ